MTTVKASTGGRSASYATVMAKPAVMLPLPVRELDGLEAIVTGFRALVMSCADGSVATHGGFGSFFAVTLEWKGRHMTIHAQELLATWVRTFSPEDADEIMRATFSSGSEADDAAERLGGSRKRYSGSTREG